MGVGLRSHDPSTPIRVLGYDLVLSPEGVQEDWDALYARLQRTAFDITSRQCSLQGRALLTSAKLSSRLWYKFRLSSPSKQQLTRFDTLAWNTLFLLIAELAACLVYKGV